MYVLRRSQVILRDQFRQKQTFFGNFQVFKKAPESEIWLQNHTLFVNGQTTAPELDVWLLKP